MPTPQEVVERMLEIAKVGPDDYVIDLGSGDGRIVVTAAKKFGARGFGVDLNPTRIDEANANARTAGVTDKVAFYQRDLFETDLAQASVITMYLLPRVNLELRPKILDLKPGTRIVSHDFSMDDWKPDLHEELEAKDKYGGSGGRSDIYFWIVPAKVAGTWQSQLQVRGTSIPYEFTLAQQYQVISGSARVAGRNVQLQNAKITGDALSFDLTADVDGAPVKHTFTGRINGDAIMGTADLGGSAAAVAPRLECETLEARPRVRKARPPVPLQRLIEKKMIRQLDRFRATDHGPRRSLYSCLPLFSLGAAQPQDYGDTPYVQTPQNVVDRMLEVAKVGPKDFVIDLGSGDGRMVITAAQRYGAHGFGVDLDRRLVTLSNRLAAKAGVADRAVFYERDIYQTDLSPATVVTIYLLPEVNLMMRPRLLSMLKPGTRVVSHDYDMGEWPPDVTFTMDAPDKPVGRDKKKQGVLLGGARTSFRQVALAVRGRGGRAATSSSR